MKSLLNVNIYFCYLRITIFFPISFLNVLNLAGSGFPPFVTNYPHFLSKKKGFSSKEAIFLDFPANPNNGKILQTLSSLCIPCLICQIKMIEIYHFTSITLDQKFALLNFLLSCKIILWPSLVYSGRVGLKPFSVLFTKKIWQKSLLIRFSTFQLTILV